MLASAIFAVFGLVSTVAAVPVADHIGTISADDLIKIAPETASCAGAEFPKECATAATAATNIDKSFKQYGIKSFGAQAALVSTILLESGNFKYSVHHFPKHNPGQGTRNMQSYTYNEKYADYLAANNICGITPEKVAAANATSNDAVLALVNSNDHLSFGSAAWLLTQTCDASFGKGLASGTEAAFTRYITDCVHTTQDPNRLAIWEKVMALKHW